MAGWIEQGLHEIRARMMAILFRMTNGHSEPAESDWEELRSWMVRLYQLKALADQMGIPVAATIIETPAMLESPFQSPSMTPTAEVQPSPPAKLPRGSNATSLGWLTPEERTLLGERVEAVRKGCGLKRAELAVKANIGVSTLTLVENGNRLPSLELLARIAEAMGTVPDVLLDGMTGQATKPPPAQAPVPVAAAPAPARTVQLPEVERPGARIGTFHQRLRGGYVVLTNGERLPLWQSVVDASGMQHGDLVEGTPAGFYDDGTPKFFFQLKERRNQANPERAEVLGTLNHRDGYFHSVDAPGGLVLVPIHDLRGQAVKGDVVTVAYSPIAMAEGAGECQGVFIRVHSTEKEPEAVPAAAPVVRPKRQQPDEPAGVEEGRPLALFKGNPRVLLVGGRNWSAYRDGLEAMGATPNHVPADVKGKLAQSRVKAADVVIVITTYMSHPLSKAVRDLAKAQDKPCWMTDKENWTGLERFLAEEVVPIWNEQVRDKA